MRRKLTRLLRTKIPAIRKTGGFTLTEVIIATSLLVLAIVPILKALTSAHVTSSIIERRTCSLNFAQAKLDEIRARSIYDYSGTFGETSQPLGGSYLCDVKDTSKGTDLREIEISVGCDLNGNSALESDEIEITLVTLIARRW